MSQRTTLLLYIDSLEKKLHLPCPLKPTVWSGVHCTVHITRFISFLNHPRHLVPCPINLVVPLAAPCHAHAHGFYRHILFCCLILKAKFSWAKQFVSVCMVPRNLLVLIRQVCTVNVVNFCSISVK
jgi:hypothetical protein